MKGKKLLMTATAALMSVVSLASCNRQPASPAVDGLRLFALDADGEEADGMYVTESLELGYTYDGDKVEDATATYVSSDPAVISVTEDEGVFYANALKAGVATVTLTLERSGYETVKADLNLTAYDTEVSAVYLASEDDYGNAEEELLVGDYLWLDVDIDADGPEDDLTVTSSDPEKVSINLHPKYGYYALGLALGKVTITAKSVKDPTVSASIPLTVVEPYVRSINLDTTGVYLVVGSEKNATHELQAEAVLFDSLDDNGDPEHLTGALTFASDDSTIATVSNTGVITAVAEGVATITVTSEDDLATAKCTVTVKPAGSKLPAEGAYSYVYKDNATRTEILGTLEKYAVESKLTGLTLFGDGGYVMYDHNVEKGTNNYVPGFGFGIASSGDIKADLASESNAKWKRYYHTYETEDPASLNYMDDKGSVVGDLIGYVSAGYFATYLNEEGNGYNWVGDLATVDRPIALNADANGLATKYRFPVKVGADLKYRTASTTYSKYNNREVALEDYITPYQIYYTQSYGLERSAENLSGSGSIKGAKNYYEKSKNGFSATAWADIGIKAYVEDGQSYLEFEFNSACTPFYAMYYLTSSMFAPVPEAFIKELGGGDLTEGVNTWGKFNSSNTISPVDTWLSTGPFYVEQWDYDQQIVFGKNENYDDHDGEYYKIKGYHFNILKAATQDPEAALKEFLAGKIHSCGIPSTQLKNYVNDDRTTMTTDSSTYKLNLNTCDEETWEALFGVNGTIAQTPKSQYWDLEPAMSNLDFVSGLSFALNRKELATNLGRTPTANYFGASYMSDPENGISYNTTQAHKDAVSSLVSDDTDEYGYSLELAKASFKKAANQLIDDGVYKAGDTIHVEIAWMYASQESQYHNVIKKYLEDAFNTNDNPLKLVVDFWVGASWSDVYYNKMMLGQFDIGFGSISGNSYNPLNFLEVLKSDNSSGFTLNWGIDTNAVDGSIEYDNQIWSFDGLWTAADQGAYIVEGANSPLDKTCGVTDAKRLESGELVVTAFATELDIEDAEGNVAITTRLYMVTLFAYYVDDDGNQAYDDFYAVEDETKTFKYPDESQILASKNIYLYQFTYKASDLAFLESHYGNAYAALGGFMFDFYYETTVFGGSNVSYTYSDYFYAIPTYTAPTAE